MPRASLEGLRAFSTCEQLAEAGRAESPLLEDSSAPDQVDDLNLEDLNEYEKKVADW